MEIQNITSSVSRQFQNQNDEKNDEVSFTETVSNTGEKEYSLQEQDLTFQKIKGMTIGEIEDFYKDKNQNVLLNTLKLSTMFSANSSMNEAMFNMVLSQDNLTDSTSYLSNMISNRNSYLSKGNDHGSGLRKSIISQLDGEVKAEQIKLEKEFQFTMLQFDVTSHMNDMMDFSRNERDKNRDNSGLSFLYDNMYLQYQSLFDEYETIENKNSDLLAQQLESSRLHGLKF